MLDNIISDDVILIDLKEMCYVTSLPDFHASLDAVFLVINWLLVELNDAEVSDKFGP